ncbi:MAG: asparagine synthase-related protein, partial [Acidobacteriota bacterium]|nr:asparagine synthase-related protein [Acidobacteriota bacterium]
MLLNAGYAQAGEPLALRCRPAVSSLTTKASGFSATQHPERFRIAADVQLHNRVDLIAALGSPGLKDNDDSELLLAAFEKWGERCVDFIAGEFAFVIWDGRLRRLFCCRDHIGSRPFFYHFRYPRFVFGTDPSYILKSPGFSVELNRRKLRVMSTATAASAYPGETVHSGVFALPAATWIMASESGLRQQAYWEPRVLPSLVPPRPRDAFEALRELLFEAVECRIRGFERVAVFLSGGLDSSALAAIASRSVPSDSTLLAPASVLPDDHAPVLTDEREYIDEFRSWPNIGIRYVTAPGQGPFDGIEDASRFELNPFPSSRAFLARALEDRAVAGGAQIILEGLGGEYGLTASGDGYSLELAARLKGFALSRQLSELRRVNGESPPRVLAREVRNMLSRRSERSGALFSHDFRREQPAPDQFEFGSANHRTNQITELKA